MHAPEPLKRLLDDPATPRWLREVDQFLPVKSQFVLYGNVRDQFPWPDDDPDAPPGYLVATAHEYLVDYLALKGFEHFFIVNPLHGITLAWPSNADKDKAPHTTAQWVDRGVKLRKDVPDPDGSDVFRFDLDPATRRWRCRAVFGDAVRFAEAVAHAAEARCVVLFDYLMGQTQAGQTGEREPFVRSLIASYEVRRPTALYNPIFWLCDRENDLPAWFALNNPRIRTIGVPQPDGRTRALVGGSLLRNLPDFATLPPDEAARVTAEFGQQTDGLLLNDLDAIVKFIPAQGLKATETAEAARRYKLGVTEDPWRKVTREHLQRAEALIRTRVKGQDRAVAKAMDTLRKSVAGIAGAHAGRTSGKPKGVLFFAGPTGVGKTELAKSITEGLFGDENAYIRFDMSEFNHEHADQRLIGAPPGYIGFEAGGELTRAIRERPFSVVLFDEIEKAHPKILDKFLQILDDGQLTSGKGERVYFSDSVIVFTSNLGMAAARTSDDYARLEEKLRQGITDHFTSPPPKGLNRPELLNRIGDNIVVFDYIRPDVAVQILARKVGHVLQRVQDSQGIVLTLDGFGIEGTPEPGSAFAFLVEHCATQLDHGGRGIGNLLETVLVDSLARALWDGGWKAGDTARIARIRREGEPPRYALDLERA